jgi:SAGA-associated factor 29
MLSLSLFLTTQQVTSVIGEGKQRRYEIIDSDPEPPTPAVPYRASVNHLVPIPPKPTNLTLPDLPKHKNVLALYPSTTTFYKAEVVVSWRAPTDGKATVVKKEREGGKEKEEGGGGGGKDKDKGVVGQEIGEEYVRLRFEGEDEADREMSVERRYVLPDKA